MRERNPWDEVAEVYEKIRPGYPDQLVQDIIDGARLTKSDRLLEIGAGTGKATVSFAQRGFRVHCVEPGPNLAEILIRKCSPYPNVSAEVSTFEEWTPGDRAQFDLIFCAQAFNWLDPKIRYRKCHQLLREDGHLALFWYGDEHAHWETDVLASGLFDDLRVFKYHTEFESDADDCVRALESTSSFTLLDEEAKSKLRDETRRNAEAQGGSVSVRLNYWLYLAQRIKT